MLTTSLSKMVESWSFFRLEGVSIRPPAAKQRVGFHAGCIGPRGVTTPVYQRYRNPGSASATTVAQRATKSEIENREVDGSGGGGTAPSPAKKNLHFILLQFTFNLGKGYKSTTCGEREQKQGCWKYSSYSKQSKRSQQKKLRVGPTQQRKVEQELRAAYSAGKSSSKPQLEAKSRHEDRAGSL